MKQETDRRKNRRSDTAGFEPMREGRRVLMSDMENNEKYWLFLSCVEGLGCRGTDRLLEYFGTAEGIFTAKEEELWSVQGVSAEAVSNITELRKSFDPDREYEKLKELKVGYVGRQHPKYPARLAAIGNPPNGLFYRGKLPGDSKPAIAVIGSRACSNYGRDVSIGISRDLARAGVDVISGMAQGVDGFAHRGALEGGGDTYAVLGTGVDICFPASNRDIYMKIPGQGGVLSEYMPGTKGLPVNFPRRNRIISALADGIVVVEARLRSGTWITVDMGLEQGKTIYAVPGRIGDSLSFGCNRLIRQGARLVMGADDILADLAGQYGYIVDRPGCGDSPGKNGSTGAFTGDEKKLLKVLDTVPKTVGELAAMAGLKVPAAIAGLTMLEIRGMAELVGSGSYIKKIL